MPPPLWPNPITFSRQRRPLPVSSSAQGQTAGNNSVACSRIYLQAARSRGRGSEQVSEMPDLTAGLSTCVPIAPARPCSRPSQGSHRSQAPPPPCARMCGGHEAITQSGPRAETAACTAGPANKVAVCRTKMWSHEGWRNISGAENEHKCWRQEGCHGGGSTEH